ncbi:MAG: AMP-binding protein [Rhodospirillales bacterium]|jgi:long-chain acyl-CoA synthetase|nr:AMP-dependent synthetase [Rhodospirillaceae bacterium]MDP6429328.1 AMP-binding protein [Rhodospirillales bacterium]MDP6644808.1 AMP-binding protein [Rhodospirillales bacterium]MDP6841387.1 AMP-binding protein [Rhodospirillales bacterium]|tara:strand:- start:705 stop:2225 length:1521 start_codon:yes stop_codon:yes gene_type:complete
MNLATLLHEAAEASPDSRALARGNRLVATYAGHADRSARLASALCNEFGLAAGDRVALAMNNDTAYSEIMFGAWHAGCAVVPMNARLHAREFAWILEDSGARLCFASEAIAKDLAGISEELPSLKHIITAGSERHNSLLDAAPAPLAGAGGDDLAWLFYTSGTTGRPKGAMLTHNNLRAMNKSYFASVDDIQPTDCIIHAAPMSHGSGLYMLPHVERGACQVVPESGGFDAGEIISLLEHWQGATIFMAPTMLARMVAAVEEADGDTGNLKSVIYGGAPMYLQDCLKSLEVLGPKLVQIYGQGEAPMTITVLNRAAHMETAHPRYHHRLASVGTAQAGVQVRIADENDADLPGGEIGEVLVRGDVVMAGYWRNAEATDAALGGGWLHTGDLGAFDEDGYLTLKDRSKDVIISGGTNIYPREVEEVLLRDGRVLECSVIGGPDPDWGEQVVAFIVVQEGATVTEKELDALCLEHIARFKRPKTYRFLGALPKNNYGKVLKTKLRQML